MATRGFPDLGSRPADRSPAAGSSAIPLDATKEEPLAETPPVSDEPTVRYVALDDDRPDPSIIEPGRALALADFAPPSLGAGDRLVRFAYGLGLPASAVHPFRKRGKTRLTATVTPPLPGDPASGKALRAGHFLIHGFKSPIADTAFSGPRLPPAFERMVHGFRWLRDSNPAARGRNVPKWPSAFSRHGSPPTPSPIRPRPGMSAMSGTVC